MTEGQARPALGDWNIRLWLVEMLVNQIARGADIEFETDVPVKEGDLAAALRTGPSRVIIHCLAGREELNPRLLTNQDNRPPAPEQAPISRAADDSGGLAHSRPT
jgi:hypothetical protein